MDCTWPVHLKGERQPSGWWRAEYRGSAPGDGSVQLGGLVFSTWGAFSAHHPGSTPRATRARQLFLDLAEQYGGIARWVLLLLRNQNFPGSESRARLPVPVQVGLDSAHFQTQYTKRPSCGLQARVGPARSSLAVPAPHGRKPRGNGASIPLAFVTSTVALGIVARPRRRRHHPL